ncbi:MAG: dihydropyrimidinase [Tissierellia bacterium]|nr:dihydropyrimidinase [Tissierellia bacterium]
MIIKNGNVVTDKVTKQDIRLEGELIKEIGLSLEPFEGEEVIDATGCYVFPGFIDAHTHMQMTNPIASTSDDYDSGTAAAVLGGTTGIINFCTGHPDMTLTESYEEEMRRVGNRANCHYKFHMELVKVDDKILEEMPKMKDLGIHSFKIYMAYGFRLSDKEIYRALQKAKECNMLVESHCETGDVLECIMEDLVKEGKNIPQYQGVAHPAEAEAESVARLSYMAKLVDVPIHIVHLSTKLGLEEVRKARNIGVDITAESCPQYITLDDSVYKTEGIECAKYVYAPPARGKEDKAAILEGLLHGEIQTMATDHCSFSYEDKKKSKGDLTKIAGGIPGVEHRVPISYTELVVKNNMSEVDFVKLLAENPAKLYDIYPQKGVLQEGSDGDIVIYDPEGSYEISAKTQNQKVDFTPYEGYITSGKVRDVLLQGKVVVKDGKLVNKYQGTYMK